MWFDQLKNGKYVFRERKKLPNGKYITKSKVFDDNKRKTQKMAKEMLDRLLQEEYDSFYINNKASLGNVVDMFLKEAEVKYKPNTFYMYTFSLKNLIDRFNRDTKIENLTQFELINYCLDKNKVEFSMIKNFLKWCFKRDFIEKDISEKIYTLHKPSKTLDKKLYFEKEELRDIFDKIEALGDGYRYKTLRLIVEFLTLTGLRIGECLALTKNDINDYTIKVTKNISQTSKVSETKTAAGMRDVVMNSRAKQILSEMELYKRMYNIDSDICFPNSLGNNLHYSALSSELRKVGVSGFHIFRHTHASILAAQGVSLSAIQRRLGHESDKITADIYVHVMNKAKKEEYDMFRSLDIL